MAGLFKGLDYARVDDQAGSIGSLIQEIWRLFLVAMMVAMVAERRVCLPKLTRPAGAASANVSRSLTFLGTRTVVGRRVDRGRALLPRSSCTLSR